MKKTNSPVAIPVSKLRPFEGHPYKVLDDDGMNELIESIQLNGVLEPLKVRPIENTDAYEIISGHRRFRAAQKAGLDELPAFICAVTRDEAAIMLVDSNLHRERILPSEKAFAYKLKLEAMSRQGFRSDLASDQIGRKSETAEIIAEQANESKTQVRRYIRLTYLIPSLLDLMDSGKIAFSVGVELSFLDEDLQRAVLDACEENDCTPSYSQAVRLHRAANAGELDRDGITEIMSEEKANQREKVTIQLHSLKKFVPNADPEKAKDYIMKACEYYRKYLIRQREAR